MKISVSFFLSTILMTSFSILAVNIFCANEEYLQLQQEVEEVVTKLQNADFSETICDEMNRTYKHIEVTKESAFMYRVDALYTYEIPMLFFRDEIRLHSQLYRGGW